MSVTTPIRPGHDEDFYAWTLDQARRLREFAKSRPNEPIDWELVAEEIEDVGISDRRGADSYLRLVLVHLMKLEYAADAQPVRHWRAELKAFRVKLDKRLTPSLRPQLQRNLAESYQIAYADAIAALWQDVEFESRLPRTCPYTFEQITGDWLPEQARG